MVYLAPEYVYSGVLTLKTDVYSFGAVVLEVATGRRPVNVDQVVVTDYVWENGVIVWAADPKWMGRFELVEMERVLILGLCCAHLNSEKRSRMTEAARMLRGKSTLPVLPMKKLLPAGCEEIMYGEDGDETQWSTPKTF